MTDIPAYKIVLSIIDNAMLDREYARLNSELAVLYTLKSSYSEEDFQAAEQENEQKRSIAAEERLKRLEYDDILKQARYLADDELEKLVDALIAEYADRMATQNEC